MTSDASQAVERLPALDGIRAVAAGAVVMTHVAFQTGSVTSGPLGAIAGRLDSGVAVFFALSGFLLVRPWIAGAGPPHGRYLVRRAARILPAYWLALVVVVATDRPGRGNVIAHAWLGQAYTGRLLPDFSQTWSLSAEVAFYALLPLFAPAFSTRSRRAQLGIVASASVVGLIGTALTRGISGAPADAGYWMPLHLDWFAVGIALAVVVGIPQDSAGLEGRLARGLAACVRQAGLCWATAGVLLLCAATPIAGPITLAPVGPVAAVVKESLYALIALLVLAPFVAKPSPEATTMLRGVLQAPMARRLGWISYGIFLWHLLVLRAVFAMTSIPTFSGRAVEVFCLTALGSIVIAAAAWLLVERPINAAVHHRSAGARSGSAV